MRSAPRSRSTSTRSTSTRSISTRSACARVVVTAVAAGLLALGVLGVGAPSAAGATAAPTQTSGTAKVKVGDNFFEPETLEITAGTKVTWKNEGKVLHNVRPVKKGAKWGTTSLTRGKSYSHTFKKPGKYVYYCSFHGSPTGGQRGTIVVSAPAPVTTTTSTPGG